jgi:transposase
MTTVELKPKPGPSVARQKTEHQRVSPVDHHPLAKAVEAAVRAVDSNTLTPVAPVDAGVALQPKALLAVLAFSYARQIYASSDIEASLRGDSNFRQLCREQFPDARMLRRFRRENRKAVLTCVTAALRFLAEQKVAQGLVTHVNEAHVNEEANRRIIMAMFTDSLAATKDQTRDTPVDLCYLFANRRPRTH